MKWINRIPRWIQNLSIAMVVVVPTSVMMAFVRHDIFQGFGYSVLLWLIFWLAIEFYHHTIDR